MQTRPRDLAAGYARGFALNFLTLRSEGAGNAGCPLHPRPRVHFVVVERTRVTTSTPESPGIPRAMVLRFPSCSPRRSGSFATVTCGTYRKLDTSVEMSGPHDFTVRIGIARLARRRVHRSPSLRP